MSTIALIPARGGSKGIKNKNIVSLSGKPLIQYTIESALEADGIDHVIVSTDDEKIANISRELGARVLIRPDELAQDTTHSADVIKHACEELEKEFKINTVIFLQPTSPLRKSQHINEALNYYLKHDNCNGVISVFEPGESPLKYYEIDKAGLLQGGYTLEAPYQRRQDLPKTYMPNGAIFIFSLKNFQIENCIPKQKMAPYIMSDNMSIDINNTTDLKIASLFLEEQCN